MHQLAVLSTGWGVFFHLTSDGVHHNPFFFLLTAVVFFWGFVLGYFFSEPDLTHRYPTRLPTLISIVPTLVPY